VISRGLNRPLTSAKVISCYFVGRLHQKRLLWWLKSVLVAFLFSAASSVGCSEEPEITLPTPIATVRVPIQTPTARAVIPLPPVDDGLRSQLERDCPHDPIRPLAHGACVDNLATIVSISSKPYGRVALCVDTRGGWTVAAEKGSPPSDSLTRSHRIGDPCPGARGFVIKAIFD
jgi:hypothetical protein